MSPDTLSLVGKTAIVTGSGRETGIGAAIARGFARNGASVAIHYVSDASKPRAEKVAANITKEFGTKTTVVQGDLGKSDTARKLVEQILEAFGVDHIDILGGIVNNAAAAQNITVMQATEEQLSYEYAVNVFGTIYMTQAVVETGRMPNGGRIINIGSIASKILIPNIVYCAVKASVDALTTLFAAELGKSKDITVNTLAAGPTPTDMSGPYLVGPDGTPTALAKTLFEQTRAADRLGSVEDMADAALLMVSEKSRWITGQFISVSGGVTGTM